jgi:hypothetical protein
MLSHDVLARRYRSRSSHSIDADTAADAPPNDGSSMDNGESQDQAKSAADAPPNDAGQGSIPSDAPTIALGAGMEPSEIAIAAASLVPLRAAPPDITACTVAGVEYAVSEGVAHVEAAHVAQLVDIGFTL